MTNRPLITMICLIVVCLSLSAAQEKKEAPRRHFVVPADSAATEESARLPKIELPEFDITGNTTPDFPDAVKDSPDGQWTVRSSPSYATGTRQEALPPLGEQSKLGFGRSPMPSGYTGRATVGYGSHETPFFDGAFGGVFSQTDILLRAGYTSSRGHIPNADFRNGSASLGVGTTLGDDLWVFSGGQLTTRFALQGRSYRLFGSAVPERARSVNGLDIGAGVNIADDNAIPRVIRLSVQNAVVEDTAKARETIVGIELNGRREIGDFDVKGDASLWSSSTSRPTSLSDPFYTRVAGSATYRIANSLDVQFGLGLFLFRGSDTRTMGRLYPMLGISWYMSDRVTLYAKYEPSVQRSSLAEIVEGSPYTSVDIPVRHPDQFTSFSAGAEYALTRSIRSRLSLNYSRTDDLPIWVHSDFAGIWNAEYTGTTRIISLDGEMYADITEADNARLSLSVRSNTNSATGVRNPYTPLFLSNAAFQHQFAFGLTTGATLQIVGNRATDLLAKENLPAIALLNLKAEYAIIPRWSVFLLVNDLLDYRQTWWQGYPGIERTVSVGTNLTW